MDTFYGLSGFRDKFVRAMQSQFIKIDEFAEAMVLLLVSRKNGIFFGPGGFAKSEGAEFALKLVQENPDEAFFLSCGESMTEERLFGGVDIGALDNEKVIRFNAHNSFLPRRFTVFEEGLDMPDQAITSLRDTLTSKKLRNGKQVEPLMSESIFILTNREPKEKAGVGDSMKALLTRFPIQMRVAWDSHTSDDYLQLLQSVAARPDIEAGVLAQELRQAQQLFQTVDLSGSLRTLSELLARAGEVGDKVSPRTAILSEAIVKASVAARGGTQCQTRDLFGLRFIPELACIDDLHKEIRDAFESEEKAAAAEQLAVRFHALQVALRSAAPQKMGEINKELRACNAQISAMGVSSEVTKRARQLEAASQLAVAIGQPANL